MVIFVAVCVCMSASLAQSNDDTAGTVDNIYCLAIRTTDHTATEIAQEDQYSHLSRETAKGPLQVSSSSRISTLV